MIDKQKFFQFCQKRTNQLFNDYLESWESLLVLHSSELRAGIVLISLKNTCDHNYQHNVPLLFKEHDIFFNPSGSYGNHLGLRLDCIRPATYNEICKLTDGQINCTIRDYRYINILKLKGVINETI